MEAIRILKQSLKAMQSELITTKSTAVDAYDRYQKSELRVLEVESKIRELEQAILQLEKVDGSKSKKVK